MEKLLTSVSSISAFELMRIACRNRIGGLHISYNQAPLFVFTLLEAQLGIIFASIPVMLPVIRKGAHTSAFEKLRTIFTASKDTTAASISERPRTIGSKENRLKLQKLDSGTDSILSDEISGHLYIYYNVFNSRAARAAGLETL
jgi:hypothetical protein